MFREAKIPISEDIYANFHPLIYFIRIFGIFPLKMEKSESGIFLKWSPWYALYSYAFGVVTIFTAIYGELSDVLLKGQVTMDIVTNTDLLATWVVLIVYCIATFFAIFVMGSKVSQVFDFIDCLSKVDKVFEAYSVRDKRKDSVLMTVLLFGTSGLVYIASVYAYYKVIGNVWGLIGMFVRRYHPMVTNIYVGLMVECLLRHMAASLERRFVWLNKILGKQRAAFANKGDTLKHLHHKKDAVLGSCDGVAKLNRAYLRLIKAAGILNDLFGISAVIVVLSVFFGLVRTVYYIILSLAGKRRGLFELTMRLSIFSHQVMRTLFFTESLYWCKSKMQVTEKCVCDLLPENYPLPHRNPISAFITSACLLEHKFSACGLFYIDRFLITTLIQSITTYVVVLLQAQATDKQ